MNEKPRWKNEIDRLVQAKDLAALKKLRDKMVGWEQVSYLRCAIQDASPKTRHEWDN